MNRPKIQGGSCDIYPLQWCIIWAAYRQGAISWLAFKVWCAAWLIYTSRCTQRKQGTPYRFQLSEFQKFFKQLGKKALEAALAELEATNLLRFSDQEIWFATDLDDVNDARVRTRAEDMFEHLHVHTRTKRMPFPRRLLKLIVKCGQKIVRVATMLGVLLRIMLVKRYDDYKGCVKAAWIATVFGVSKHRVQSERMRLINEGLFRRLPTSQRARNAHGEWMALNLVDAEATAPVENVTRATPQVEPPVPDESPNVEPPCTNQILSSYEEILENQIPVSDDPPGVGQQETRAEPTWSHITLEDLQDFTRSEALRQEAIAHHFLTDTIAGRDTFYAAIAHALRVATTNVCGLFRVVVEQGLWQVISLADEDQGLGRLQRALEAQEISPIEQADAPLPTMPSTPVDEPTDELPTALSHDALIVQTITADLERAGVAGDMWRLVRRHGYLRDWTPARWEYAARELMHARLRDAPQRHTAHATGSRCLPPYRHGELAAANPYA